VAPLGREWSHRLVGMASVPKVTTQVPVPESLVSHVPRWKPGNAFTMGRTNSSKMASRCVASELRPSEIRTITAHGTVTNVSAHEGTSTLHGKLDLVRTATRERPGATGPPCDDGRRG
jgi:hypothetical protein